MGHNGFEVAGAAETVAEIGSASTLVDLFDDSLSRHRDRPALKCGTRSVSYGRLDESSRALAAWLQSRGLSRGDRVAVMLPNVPQYAVAVLAVLRAGCIVVNVDRRHDASELEHRLRDSGAVAVFVMDSDTAAFAQFSDAAPTRLVVVAAAGDLQDGGAVVGPLMRRLRGILPADQPDGAVRLADALAAGRRLEMAPVALAPDDIAAIQYTAGTTAPSKGAVLLHRNLVANVLQSEAWCRPLIETLPPGEQLQVACVLPLHHVYAFGLVLLLGLRIGACTVLVANGDEPSAVLRELARHPCHVIPGIDPLFAALLDQPGFGRVDWTRLRLTLGGGMAVRSETADRWKQATGCTICEGYGLTEASPSVSCNPVDCSEFSGHIGLPLPGTAIRLLDADGAEVGPGTPGEIVVSGPQVMAGYWQRPDETARVMTADGGLRTGDIAVRDDDGHLRIVDRRTDSIRVDGHAVYPNAVEQTVARLPGVLECAAVGVPDGDAGEAIKLIVVRRDPDDPQPDAEAVHDWCRAQLDAAERPRIVEFRAELPRSASGKVLRRVLR